MVAATTPTPVRCPNSQLFPGFRLREDEHQPLTRVLKKRPKTPKRPPKGLDFSPSTETTSTEAADVDMKKFSRCVEVVGVFTHRTSRSKNHLPPADWWTKTLFKKKCTWDPFSPDTGSECARIKPSTECCFCLFQHLTGNPR